MPPTASHRPLVLIVEDEPDVAEAYAIKLRGEYETEIAIGGEAALETIDGSVDAVLLDRRMPDKHGDEVLTELRERGYDCPVIMATAVSPDLNILEMDFDDYLCKPITGDTLPKTLAQHVGRNDQRDPRLDEFFELRSKRAVDRFHTYWRGSQVSARQWLRRFRHHYNHERPNQALNGRTPAEEVQNWTVPTG